METNDSELPGVVGGAAYRLETDYIFLAASLCPSPPLSFSSFSSHFKRELTTLQNDWLYLAWYTQMLVF